MKLLVNILLVNAVSFAYSDSHSGDNVFLKGPTSKSTIYGADGSQQVTIQEAGSITPNGNVGPTFTTYLIDANGNIVESKNGEVPPPKNCDNGAPCKEAQNTFSFESNSISPDSITITSSDNVGAATYNQPNFVSKESPEQSSKDCHGCATVDENNTPQSEGFNVNIAGPKSSSTIKATFTEGTISTGTGASSTGTAKLYGENQENSGGVRIIGPSAISVIKHSFDESDQHRSSNVKTGGHYSGSAAGGLFPNQGYQDSGSLASGTSIRENYDQNQFAGKQIPSFGSKPSSTNIIGPSATSVIGTSEYTSKGYHQSVNSPTGSSSFGPNKKNSGEIQSVSTYTSSNFGHLGKENQRDSSSVNIQGPKFSVFGTPSSANLGYHASSSNLNILKENQPQSPSVNIQGPTSTAYQGYHSSSSNLNIPKENQSQSSVNLQGPKFSVVGTSPYVTQGYHPSSSNLNIPKSNSHQFSSVHIQGLTDANQGYHSSSSNLNIRKENQPQSPTVNIQGLKFSVVGTSPSVTQGYHPSSLNLNIPKSNQQFSSDHLQGSTDANQGYHPSSSNLNIRKEGQYQSSVNIQRPTSSGNQGYQSSWSNLDTSNQSNFENGEDAKKSAGISITGPTFSSTIKTSVPGHQGEHQSSSEYHASSVITLNPGQPKSIHKNNDANQYYNLNSNTFSSQFGQLTPSVTDERQTIEFNKKLGASGGKTYQSGSGLTGAQRTSASSLNHYQSHQNQLPTHLNPNEYASSGFGAVSFSSGGENSGKLLEQKNDQSTASVTDQHQAIGFNKNEGIFGGKNYQSTTDSRHTQFPNHQDQFSKRLNSKESGAQSFSGEGVIATYDDSGKFPEQNRGESSSAKSQFSASKIDFSAQHPNHNQESDSITPSTSTGFGDDVTRNSFSGNKKFTGYSASSVTYNKNHNPQEPCTSNNCNSASNSIVLTSAVGERKPKFLDSNNVNRGEYSESSSSASPTFSNTGYESNAQSNIKGNGPINLADCYYFMLPTYANISPGDYAIYFKKVPHVQE